MGGITPFRNQQLFVFLGPQSANKRIRWVLQGSSSISTPTCCTGHGRLCQTDFGQTDFCVLANLPTVVAKPIVVANISCFCCCCCQCCCCCCCVVVVCCCCVLLLCVVVLCCCCVVVLCCCSHTTARELQTCTFQGSGLQNTTKIPREDTQRDTERVKR